MTAETVSISTVLNLDGFEKSVRKFLQEPAPVLYRMVVLDVISNPSSIDQTKIDYWENVLKISNIRFANILPRNTIIAQKILRGKTEVTNPMFLLPFFPSHLSLPCKSGELVWAMFEDPNARFTEMGYWFCRISEPHFIDDVNHTHHPRQFDHSLIDSTSDNFSGPSRVYENRLGRVVLNNKNERFVEPKSEILPLEEEDGMEKLLTNTDAGRIMQYESVPRFRKRPGDIAFEGTNNSLIVLGTDRIGSLASYEVSQDEPEKGLIPSKNAGDFEGFAGSIDIVAGRGTLPETGGKEISVTEINTGQELKKELGKQPEDLSEGEGNPDFINDRSRILVSQRTSVDSNFGLSNHNSQFSISDSPAGDSGIIIKSDKVRIIARSDISFIVKNFEIQEASGSKPPVMIDNQDETKWASITIKTNGDIVFTPSSEGVIKLGGEQADKAIVCTDLPATNSAGTVTAPALFTTGGSQFATTFAAQGTFASKVLVT